MHELSIAAAIVDLACEEAEKRGVRVTAVHLKLGALSGVVKEALLGSFEFASAGTPLDGSRLIVSEIPVAIFCPVCRERRTLPSIQRFRCPVCGEPARQILEGEELQVSALEIGSAAEVIS